MQSALPPNIDNQWFIRTGNEDTAHWAQTQAAWSWFWSPEAVPAKAQAEGRWPLYDLDEPLDLKGPQFQAVLALAAGTVGLVTDLLVGFVAQVVQGLLGLGHQGELTLAGDRIHGARGDHRHTGDGRAIDERGVRPPARLHIHGKTPGQSETVKVTIRRLSVKVTVVALLWPDAFGRNLTLPAP